MPAPHAWSDSQGLPRWMLACGLLWALLLQLLLTLIWWFPEAKTMLGDEVHYWRSAQAFLDGGPWHPSPVWPPLQVLVLAFFQGTGAGMLGLQMFQVALLLGSAALLMAIVRRLCGSLAAGQAAALLYLGYPPLAAFVHYLWPELLHLLFMLLLIWLPLCRARSHWMPLALGAALAGALMTKNLLLPLAPAILLLAASGQGWRRGLLRVLVAGACCLILLAPALQRGHELTGRVVVADSSVFNVYVGLIDEVRSGPVFAVVAPAFREYMASADSHAERDRIYREKIRELLREQGVLATAGAQLSRQYFRLFSNESFLALQFSGSREQGLTSRYSSDFGRHGLIAASVLLHLLMLGLAPLGFALKLPGTDWRQYLLPALLVFQLALFLLVHVRTRFFLTLLPVFACYAGIAIAALLQRQQQVWPPPWQWPLIVAAAALLWFLALGGPWLDRWFS